MSEASKPPVTREEVEQIADKVIEISDRLGKPNTKHDRDSPFWKKEREAMRGWTIIGTEDTLQALAELGYVVMKTKVGVFYEIPEVKR